MTRVIPAAFALAAAVSGCGGGADESFGDPIVFEAPETAVDYVVALEGAPSEEAEALIRESLDLYRRQEDGAQSLAFLRRRAERDVERVQAILRSFGYYEGDASAEIVPPERAATLVAEAAQDDVEGTAPPPAGDSEVDAAAATDEEDAAPERPVAFVRMTVQPNDRFTLARHEFLIAVPGDRPAPTFDASAFGSPVGDAAAAAPILAAEEAVAAELRRSGRPYAATRGREAVADLEANTLEVDSRIAAGPYLTYGGLRFEGLEAVDPDYLATYLPWAEGDPVNVEQLRDMQRDLAGTNLFDTISVRVPVDPPAADGPAPVTFVAEEAEFRTVTAGARYDTDIGPAARATFTHRNLFGRNETVNLEAEASFEEQRLTARYRVPQWLRPGQDFLAGAEIRNLDNDAFDEQAGTLTVGVERELSEETRVGLGGLLEFTQTSDEDGDKTFYLAGLPGFLAQDTSDDDLNPTEGYRARIGLTPFVGYEDDGDVPLFTKIEARVSGYYPIDEARDYVLAGRARLGSIVSEEIDVVPAPRRFYSGGGGSVRGYAERAIGPEDEDGDPSGGLSVAEIGAELRARVAGAFGVAAFVEGGSVSEDQVPTFSEGMQFAAGAGARYYSPIGPIRFDVGVPLNPDDDDESFQFYLSIGQAY